MTAPTDLERAVEAALLSGRPVEIDVSTLALERHLRERPWVWWVRWHPFAAHLGPVHVARCWPADLAPWWRDFVTINWPSIWWRVQRLWR